MKQTLCLWLSLALLPLSAFASGEKLRVVKAPEPYIQECSGCHIAYQPGLLPGKAWQNIMQGLEQHYGTDSSLAPELVQLLSVWLFDNAATGRGGRFTELPQEDRITKAYWYSRKHRKIDNAVWRLESVNSRANCEVCHDRAEEGRYDKKNLTIPEGLSELQNRPFLKARAKYGSDKYGKEQGGMRYGF
jgi:hypothetical protein